MHPKELRHYDQLNFGIVQDISRRVSQRLLLEERYELADQAEKLFDTGHYIYDEEAEKYTERDSMRRIVEMQNFLDHGSTDLGPESSHGPAAARWTRIRPCGPPSTRPSRRR